MADVVASTDALNSRVGRGVAWSALNSSVLRVGQFFIAIVTARLVSPAEFGVFVVALTVFSIVVNVSEVGVSAAIIREPDRTRQIAPTVSTIAIVTSALLAVMMAIAAPALAHALGADAASTAVRILALTVVIGGAGAVPSAVLTRDYRQERVFVVDVTVFVISSAVLITMASTGAGVLALVWSRVVGQCVSTALFVALSPERYRPGFDRAEARHLFRFGLPLAGANLLGFTVANIDFVIVGRLRGARQLGLYNLAYAIASWPVTIFTAILNNVTLTTLSRARSSWRELEAHLAAAVSTLAALSFPVSAMCVALAKPLIDSIYGTRWSDAAPALVALSVFGSTRVVVAVLSDLLVALGYTKQLLIIQLVWLVALLPAMIVGVDRWGIVGAGVAHTVVVLVVVLPSYALTLRSYAGATLRWMIGSVVPPLLAATAAALAAFGVAAKISNAPLALLCGGLIGTGCYVALLGHWLRARLLVLARLYGNHRRQPNLSPPQAPGHGAQPVAGGSRDLAESMEAP